MDKIEKYVNDLGSDSIGVFGGILEGGAHCQQMPDEIAPCISAILKSGKEVNAFLEIGAAAGGTTKLFHHFFKPMWCVFIDDNMHAKHVLRSEILTGIEHREVIGDSHTSAVFEAVASVTRAYDICVVDGDHSYDGVKLDVQMYGEIISDDGFLVFHDTVHWSTPGVKRFVAELKDDPAYKFIGEYISKKHEHPCGVALFQKKGTKKDKK